jgi:hypothetical protein
MGNVYVVPCQEERWKGYIDICKAYGFGKIVFGCTNTASKYTWINEDPDKAALTKILDDSVNLREKVGAELWVVASACPTYGQENFFVEVFAENDSQIPELQIHKQSGIRVPKEATTKKTKK